MYKARLQIKLHLFDISDKKSLLNALKKQYTLIQSAEPIMHFETSILTSEKSQC